MVSAAVLSFAARWGSPDAISRLAIHQRRELLHTAAGKGELEKVKILVEDAGLPVTADAMAAAAAAGHLPVCQWLHEQSCPWQRTDSEPRPPPPATLLKALQHSDHGQGGYPAMRAAAQAGHLDICQWLHGAGCPAKPAQILAWAASGGHVHVCEWALSLGFSWSPLALNEDEDREGRVLRHSTPGAGFREAAAGGHRALCEFMLGRGCMPFSLAPAIAIAGGHVELCEWYLQLHERAPDAHPVDWTRLPVFAAFGAELPTLQHVVARAQGRVGDAWRTAVIASIDAIVAAAASSTPDAVAKLRWLHGTQGVRILDLYAIGVAAAMGGPEGVGVLWELLAQAEAREAAEVAAAAAGGVQQRQQRRQEQIAALHALAIAHKYGEAREELGNIAAHNGRVAVLEALRGAGWEPTVDAAVKAAAAGQGDAVAWFLERIGEQCRQDPELVAAAATSGSTAVVKQLRAAGCAWGEEATWGAALHGNGELLEWLVEQGCPVGVCGHVYVHAAHAGDLPTLERLRRLGFPLPRHAAAAVLFTSAVCARWADDLVPGGRPEPEDEDVQEERGQASLPALGWLLDAGMAVDWRQAVEAARLRRGDAAGVAEWLREQRRQRAGGGGTRVSKGRRPGRR